MQCAERHKRWRGARSSHGQTIHWKEIHLQGHLISSTTQVPSLETHLKMSSNDCRLRKISSQLHWIAHAVATSKQGMIQRKILHEISTWSSSMINSSNIRLYFRVQLTPCSQETTFYNIRLWSLLLTTQAIIQVNRPSMRPCFTKKVILLLHRLNRTTTLKITTSGLKRLKVQVVIRNIQLTPL